MYNTKKERCEENEIRDGGCGRDEVKGGGVGGMR